MNKVTRFVFETAYGPFVTWCCSAVVLFVTYALSPPLGKFGTTMVNMMVIVQVIAALAGVIAFFISLNERKYGRAMVQFFLGIAGLLLFCMGLAAATFASWHMSLATGSCGPPRYANLTNKTDVLEFAVEYRPAHPFLAEYDKCIVFPSGKRIGILMDTGGAGPFAVYRLPTREYYLVDGLENDFIRSDYRVNVTNETVEIMCDETWVKIPDKTLKVDGWAKDSISVKTEHGEKRVVGGMPVGDSLKGRIYVGLLYPSGRFEPGEGDPFADIIEPKWKAVKLDGGEVPFSLECKRWKGSHYYRLVFASGARIALGSDGCISEAGYSLCALKDGRYHLFNGGQNDRSWREEWRIDVAGETVEVMFKDHWGRYGDLWVKIPSGATFVDGGISISGGENGKPLSVSIIVDTDGGNVTGHDFEPVGDSLSNAKLIGTFHPPDDDPRSNSRKLQRR